MPFPVRLTFTGNVGHVYQDDGSKLTFIPYTENQWHNQAKSPTGGNPTTPGTRTGITAEMVEAAVTSVGASVGAMLDTSANIAKAFNDAIEATYPDILTNKNRAACLVGECAQETDWFKTTTEYTAGSNPYSPYDGRGFIQLTHQGNYAGFGRWMKTFGLVTDVDYFVDNPERLADVKWAAYTAIYYFTNPKWDNRNLFQWCDTSSTPWHDISRAINRGSPNAGSPSYGEAERTTAINAVLAVTPDPAGPEVPPGSVQERLVAWMLDHTGDFRYSQGPKRLDPITYGEADCSSVLWYCFKTVANVHIGQWGGAHDDGQQQHGTIVIQGTGAPNESVMVPGDCVYYNWDGPSANYDHSEMYIGGNQVSSHGGPGMGPVVKQLDTRCIRAYNWRVRRFV